MLYNQIFYSNKNMRSVYFKLTDSGYVRSRSAGKIPPVETVKQLPVYRVVNEFMNPQHQEEIYLQDTPPSSTEIPNEIENHKKNQNYDLDQKEIQSPTKTWDHHNKNYYSALTTARASYEVSKQMSLKDTEISGVTGSKQKKFTIFNKYDSQATSLKQKVYESELRQQRQLRKQLQKNYESLLEALKTKTHSSEEEKESSDKQNSKTKNKTYKKKSWETEKNRSGKSKAWKRSQQKSMKKHYKRNQQDYNQQYTPRCSEDGSEYENYQTTNLTIDDFLNQTRTYNKKIVRNIQYLQKNIESLELMCLRQEQNYKSLNHKKQEMRNQRMMLQLQLKKQELLLQQKKEHLKETSSNSNGNSMPNQIHYLFMIMVFFMTIALASKSKVCSA